MSGVLSEQTDALRTDGPAPRPQYVRRRKKDRPLCCRCGTPYFAGSTQGSVVYYYPKCRCLVPNRKVYRSRLYVVPTRQILPAA